MSDEKKHADEPILEGAPEPGASILRGALDQIAEAKRILVEGMAGPLGQQGQIAEAFEKLAAVASANMSAITGPLASLAQPGTIASRMLGEMASSRVMLGDILGQLGEIPRFDMPIMERPELPVIPYRDPDEATRRVTDEIRALTQVVETLRENTRISAEVAQAALAQTAALAFGIQALHDTTRSGIEAGEARDRAGEKRDQVLINLTRALVFLAIVVAVPVLRELWQDAEPFRSSVLAWIQSR